MEDDEYWHIKLDEARMDDEYERHLRDVEGDFDDLSEAIKELSTRIQKLEKTPTKRQVASLIHPLEQRVDKFRTSFTEFQQKIEENYPALIHGLLPQIGSLRNEMQTIKDTIEGRIGFLQNLIYLLFFFIVVIIGGSIIL